MTKTAFITGIGGQDGYFLTNFLLDKKYRVFGLERSLSNMDRLKPFIKNSNLIIFFGDICDKKLIDKLVKKYKFDEIYHLAGQTSIHPSLIKPSLAYRDNFDSVITLLNSIRDFSPKTKLLLAASAELFGDSKSYPQNENTEFFPTNPYGISKLAAFWMVKYYREKYGIFACSAILFNHESEFRGENFVTRKISMGVASIAHGKNHVINLGNIGAQRDWGYAGDYTDGMIKMLSSKKAGDFVLATGKLHSVKNFVDEAFACAGIKLKWNISGNKAVGRNFLTGKVVVRGLFDKNSVSPKIAGNASKARSVLKWKPKKTFEYIVKIMVENDIKNWNIGKR